MTSTSNREHTVIYYTLSTSIVPPHPLPNPPQPSSPPFCFIRKFSACSLSLSGCLVQWEHSPSTILARPGTGGIWELCHSLPTGIGARPQGNHHQRRCWRKGEIGIALMYVFHINSLWPSDTIWWQRSGSTLTQVMACCLTTPSHYLSQCWLIISGVQWHSY